MPATEPVPQVPSTPAGTPSQVAQQQQFQEVQRITVAQSDELRALATTLQKPELSFEACTFRKGIVTAVSDGPPPSVSLQISGDTQTTVTGVRRLEGYTPLVGQTVLILKQGSEILALGHIAVAQETGWALASLNGGFSHNGNSNGSFKFRKVRDHGADKVQFKGSVSRNSGSVITTLGADFHPASRRTLMAARNSNGSNDVKVEVGTDGSVQLIGMGTVPDSFDSMNVSGGGWTNYHDHPAHSHGGSTNSADPPDGLANAHSHGIPSTDFANHRHYVGDGHTHGLDINLSVPDPSWISLNGLEYFLDDD